MVDFFRTCSSEMQARSHCCRVACLLMIVYFYVCSCLVTVSWANRDEAAALLEFFRGARRNAGHDGMDDCLGLRWTEEKITEGCPSTFCGVTCGVDGSVIALQLSGTGLKGSVLPNTLSKLGKLTILDLSHNELSDTIPDDLGTLQNLHTLDLSHNFLRGTIPSSLGTLTSLVNLSLAANKFSNSIPSSLGNLTNLMSLNLSSNRLQGSIPMEMSGMGNLRVLDLHGNQLNGAINPALLGLSSVTTVDISDNKLSGFLPWQPNDTLPLFQTLQYVNLSHNQFTGPLAPSSFTSIFAERLQVLDMSYNQLSGSLPDFQFCTSLNTLRLNHNQFTGAVPSTLLSTSFNLLQELDLSNNNLTGEMIRVLSTSLVVLNVSYNFLSGTIPQTIGSCSIVDLSNNHLSGDLSYLQYWNDMLEVLDLSYNYLTGRLMDEIPLFHQLQRLLLSHNDLVGVIPPGLGMFPKLVYIDLSFNHLNGTLPISFFNSSSYSTLLFSHNQLEGDIPFPLMLSVKSVYNGPQAGLNLRQPLGELPKIAFIDLSNNKLSGVLSEGVGNLQKLQLLNLSNNEISGTIPVTLCNLTNLQELDLSENILQGSIPSALPTSLQVLALSNNNLSGIIPESLKRFSEASFFPGNHGLFPGWTVRRVPVAGPQSADGKHKAFRAGLVAGCIGALMFVIVIGLTVYFRTSNIVGNHGNSSKNEEDHDGCLQICASCGFFVSCREPSYTNSAHPDTKNIDGLLTDEMSKDSAGLFAKVCVDDQNLSEQPTPIGSYESKRRDLYFSGEKKNSVSPKTSPHKSSVMGGKLLNNAASRVSRVQSPDRLAGELHFLDNAFVRCSAEELSGAPAEILGRSSNGTSYKATLDNGHVFTVKWLREGLARNKKEFTREAKKFARIQHINLNPLRGYYWGPQEHEKLLLWDFARGGSLAAHLADTTGLQYAPLSWQQRWKVAVSVACGLVYLHNDIHISHGNLKATNVLIDDDGSNLNICLSDYSLHLLMTPEGQATQILNAGAMGYRAPELATKKRPMPTMKGDIYAYGVLILELLTGKLAGDVVSGGSEAVDLTDWVRAMANEKRSSECLDPVLFGEALPQGIDEFVGLSLRCIAPVSSQRPSMGTIYEELSSLSLSVIKAQ
ncbi:hypothetical protein KP509_33G056100 [Ceratopteris richardii]|uniref:Protein kinase domain-containing protein n=1 Tax=Ceratopteris richardii TaxID=49495 RepID=A0A8T2QR13_CERRI|nr:hypothetical protein KP509_33G056100 [Ceratopteris richardii]